MAQEDLYVAVQVFVVSARPVRGGSGTPLPSGSVPTKETV